MMSEFPSQIQLGPNLLNPNYLGSSNFSPPHIGLSQFGPSQLDPSQLGATNLGPPELEAEALAYPATYPDFPFGPDHWVAKVKAPSAKQGRIFVALFELHSVPTVTFACDREHGEMYRAMFPGVVVRGWHCPPVQQPYNNTMPLDGSIPNEVLFEMLDHAFESVLAKIPKYQRREIEMLAAV
jgi:predicted DNA-binding protein (MmcQ/YjbR family)